MEENKSEVYYEKKRLCEVIKEIEKQLEHSKKSMNKYRKEGLFIQKSMWEDARVVYDLDDAATLWNYQTDLQKQSNSYVHYASIVKRLERMLLSPYFGRIDFIEEGEDKAEKYYIGIATLINENDEFLVYDWRAPVSSMFYDYEIGKAEYSCPAGIIKGDIALKRQYKIVKGNLEYMFDSSIKIDDDILQEVLAKSADSKMKTIITTIQKEQNKIIRNEKNKLLIVQGPAGSGKTSIALHRAAYLLYRYRDTIKSSNIAIFSPNDIFNDYISDVLPELGEENMHRTTFMDYVTRMLGRHYKYEDMNDKMEYMLTRNNSLSYKNRISCMKYKTSMQFLKLLENYINYLGNTSFEFSDIVYRGKMIITKKEIEQLYLNEYKFIPVFNRLRKIEQRILTLLEPYEKERVKEYREMLENDSDYTDETEIKAKSILMVREETAELKSYINQMTKFDVWDAYIGLFSNRDLAEKLSDVQLPENFDKIAEMTIDDIKNNIIRYEDAAPIVLLKAELGDKPDTANIKHVIIDEVQDYSPVQFRIFRKLFENAGITMLGDLNQTINPYMNSRSYDDVLEIFRDKSPVLVRLSKSYRSTKEITEFCRAILTQKDDSDYIDRKGKKPELIRTDSRKEMYSKILKALKSKEYERYNTIAVITKTAEESKSLYEFLKDKMYVKLMMHDDSEFTAGRVILPSYLAKGLEFDVVLVCGAGKEDYFREEERKLFYTICTRALHRLSLFYTGHLSPFVEGIDEKLYIKANG